MINPGGSQTSGAAAALRAAHQLIDAEPRLLTDPVILQLLDPEELASIVDHAPYFQEPRLMGLRSHIVLRSRYAEDRLTVAYACGVRQYVLLGAGLDTFAWRRPPEMSDLAVFEVDHPATQSQKLKRIARAGIGMPPNLRMAAVDFASGDLAKALADAGFDHATPSFVSCLGVLIYLESGTADTLFRFIAGLPPGTAFVFTFGRRRMTPEGSETAARVAEKEEPWRTFYEPGELESKLGGMGYRSLHFLEPAEAAALYYTGRPDGLPVPGHSSIAIATV